MEAKTSAIFLSILTLKGFTSRSRKLSAVTKQLNNFFSVSEVANLNVRYA